MDKPRGGRGHTAPYETKQMRVPTALENQVQELVSRYRHWISQAGYSSGIGANNPPSLLDKPVDKFKSQTDSSEVEALRSELEQLRSQLESTERDLLYEGSKLLSEQFRAAEILKQALTLKANSGGAIKEKIREALNIIDGPMVA